jgi:hypothetical protein
MVSRYGTRGDCRGHRTSGRRGFTARIPVCVDSLPFIRYPPLTSVILRLSVIRFSPPTAIAVGTGQVAQHGRVFFTVLLTVLVCIIKKKKLKNQAPRAIIFEEF